MSTYNYRSLPPGCVRLLRLSPHQDNTAPIRSRSEAAGLQAIRALDDAATRSPEAPFDDDDKASPDDENEASPGNEQDRLAVEKLLGRPWFRRIWVVQEVAATRHVLIICKFAEIDGQAFCSGLDRMKESLLLEDEDSRSRIRSTVNLIKDATLRSKVVVNNTSEQFSLQISSLGYLIELHRIQEATDRRDKIYALLGMSTDTPNGMVPDYQMPWKDLFSHLIKSLLPGSLLVTTIDEHQTALFTIPGRVIGVVHSVRNEDTWKDQQLVTIARHESDSQDFDDYLMSWTTDWTLQPTSKRIYRGDIVCLLQGRSLPTIVRAHRDYCSIVAIAVGTEAHMTLIEGPWHNNTEFEFLLTCSWIEEKHPSHIDEFLNARGVNPITCINWQDSDGLNTAVMLLETEQHYSAILKVHSITLASDDVGKSERANAMAVARFVDVVQKVFLGRGRHEIFDMLRNLIGKKREYVDVTEDFLIPFIISARGWEPVAFVLDTQGTPVTMTENLLVAAAENEYCGKSVMEVLLKRSDDQISVTDNCLKAAMTHSREIVRT
ncbi:het domain protein [Colletotrichum chrysophilum]|uniref:Het domain protein n=1 Tax=Colletotrichum chrysophilum TaxID=1836956 RepID=A0AAD9AVI0_9PEZI|nr:het domain protein [Colletotrichum chrysophilum]